MRNLCRIYSDVHLIVLGRTEGFIFLIWWTCDSLTFTLASFINLIIHARVKLYHQWPWNFQVCLQMRQSYCLLGRLMVMLQGLNHLTILSIYFWNICEFWPQTKWQTPMQKCWKLEFWLQNFVSHKRKLAFHAQPPHSLWYLHANALIILFFMRYERLEWCPPY